MTGGRHRATIVERVLLALLALPALASDPAVVVLERHELARVRVLERAVRRVQRRGGGEAQTLSGRRVCVPVDDVPEAERSDLGRRRVTATLRLDCDVAEWPEGRGALAFVIAQPAQGLDAALDLVADRWQVHQTAVLRRLDPRDPYRPVGACVRTNGAAPPLDVRAVLEEEGLVVRAVYEVGGCQR